MSVLLAQSNDSGAAVLGILIALGIIGLQIYLIYAIIATRNDVLWIRRSLGGGHQAASFQNVPSSPVYQSPDVPSQPVSNPTNVSGALYSVYLVNAGPSPRSVVDLLMERSGYARSGAEFAVKGTGQKVFSTGDPAAAAAFVEAVELAGGRVELRQIGGSAFNQGAEEVTPPTTALRASQMAAASPVTTKKCPDCAESILAEARVCRYCGFRFE